MQADKGTFPISQITHDFPDGLRQLAHECWDRDDLIACCELRMLHQIDDFDLKRREGLSGGLCRRCLRVAAERERTNEC